MLSSGLAGAPLDSRINHAEGIIRGRTTSGMGCHYSVYSAPKTTYRPLWLMLVVMFALYPHTHAAYVAPHGRYAGISGVQTLTRHDITATDYRTYWQQLLRWHTQPPLRNSSSLAAARGLAHRHGQEALPAVSRKLLVSSGSSSISVDADMLQRLQPVKGSAADIRAAAAALTAATITRSAEFQYPAPSVLQSKQVEGSVVFLGEKFRLRRVMKDLQKGHPVSIGVVGGSISWGAGIQRGRDDWFSRVVTTLKQVYPGSRISGRNGCMLAAKMTFLSLCLEQHVDDDVDLVFLEYQPLGPWGARDRHHMALERLMRKLLNKPHAPAVVLLQLPSLGALLPGLSSQQRTPGSEAEAKSEVTAMQRYASAYDVPYINIRDPIWRADKDQQPASQGQTIRLQVTQGLLRGHAAVADAVLGMLARCSEDMELLMGWSSWDEEHYAAPIGEPVHHGNYEEINKMCWGGANLAATVMATRGWTLTSDGSQWGARMAYIAQQPGAELLMSLDTMSRTNRSDAKVNVRIGYNRSGLQLMGRVLVQCTSGCFCKPLVLDGHRELGRASALYLSPLITSQAPSCRIVLRVLPGTASGGHMFKLAAVLVDEPGGEQVAPQADWHQLLTWVKQRYQGWAANVSHTQGPSAPKSNSLGSSAYSSLSSSSASSDGSTSSGNDSNPADDGEEDADDLLPVFGDAGAGSDSAGSDFAGDKRAGRGTADVVVFRGGGAQPHAQPSAEAQQQTSWQPWHIMDWHHKLPPHHEAEELRLSTQRPAATALLP